MKLMTSAATIHCDHDGVVTNEPSQTWVTISASPILLEPDPTGRSISRCPNISPVTKPCVLTLGVSAGYSTFVRIDRHAVCLDSLVGLTDGSPNGVVTFRVRDAGQPFVAATA